MDSFGAPQPVSGPDSTPPGPAPEATELEILGHRLTPTAVAGWFFALSTMVLILGVATNYYLTDGTWVSKAPQRSSEFGTDTSYISSTPYDLVGLGVLLAALLGLGVGFLAAYRPAATSLTFRVLAGLALFLGGVWYAAREGYDVGDGKLYGTLAIIVAYAALVWLLAAVVGNGTTMHRIRAAGFVLFSLYWATQVMRLYTVEQGDFVNAIFASFAVLFFNYFAYHELLSIQRHEDPRALHWLSGAAFITTGVYVASHKIQVVSEWLIVTVAKQTTWLLHLFNQNVWRRGGDPDGSNLYYPDDPAYPYGSEVFPIQIILACTAIQSVMIFVGGIAALQPPRRGDGLSGRPNAFERLRPTYQSRRFFALLLTVPLIYALNLMRNVTIIVLSANKTQPFFTGNTAATEFICRFDTGHQTCAAPEAAFWFSHNIIGKGGSLLALIVIAFMVFQILPELYDSLVGLLDLKRRRGPLERWWRKTPPRAVTSRPTIPGEPAPATTGLSERFET